MRQHSGFTAVELMVVVAIIAILAALALPSFAHMINKFQTSQSENALVDTIYFARSEAVKWGGDIRIERITQSATCSTGDAQDWECGWQVRLTNIPSTAVGIPANGILRTVVSNGKTDNTIRPPTTITLNAWGNPNAGLSVMVQNKKDSDIGHCINLSSGGRINKTEACAFN